MKIKEGFMLKEVAGNYVVIATGEGTLDFNSIITVNELGALIWNKIEEGKNLEEIVADILKEYTIDENTAKEDAKEFIKTLVDAGVAEE